MVIVYLVLRFLSRHQEVFRICHNDIVSTVRCTMSALWIKVRMCTRWIVDWLVLAHEEGGDVGCESADDLVLGIDVSVCPVVRQHCLSPSASSIRSGV
jgi:hypothetical protein